MGHSAAHNAIPERFYAEGVRRYGFHGLSYEYIARRLREIGPTAAAGRMIVAHLGSGPDAFVFTAGIGENSPIICTRRSLHGPALCLIRRPMQIANH